MLEPSGLPGPGQGRESQPLQGLPDSAAPPPPPRQLFHPGGTILAPFVIHPPPLKSRPCSLAVAPQNPGPRVRAEVGSKSCWRILHLTP